LGKIGSSIWSYGNSRLPHLQARTVSSTAWLLWWRVNAVLRFDNEAGKGDHKHLGQRQKPYRFSTLERLMSDFWNEVGAWHP
jgi:hypothetical protein